MGGQIPDGTGRAELDETLHKASVKLCFAELKDPVKDKLKRFGIFSRLAIADSPVWLSNKVEPIL